MTDEQLIKAFLEGAEENFNIIVNRYLKHIYNFVRQYINNPQEAEDITQDIFLKIWRNIGKFDLNKNFKIWIFQIARNSIIDYLRKKKTISFSMFDGDDNFFENIIDSGLDLEELIHKKESELEVRKILEALPEKYKSVLILYYQNEMTFNEIAEISNESINTIKSRHRRALILIRKLLDNGFLSKSTEFYALNKNIKKHPNGRKKRI